MTPTPNNDLYRSCRMLFPNQIRITVDFLRYLNIADVKSAYRTRVLENHPDRAKLLGREPRELEEHFRAINEAYVVLTEFVQKNRHSGFKTDDTATGFRFRTNPGTTPKNIVPATELMLGQYLFYLRMITITTLADAVYWQRKQRPPYGKIALDWKILTAGEITMILAARSSSEKFGEHALRNGYLTEIEHRAILGRQRMLQKPFGRYFIEQGIMRPDEIILHVHNLNRHNAAVRRMRSN